MTRIEKIKLLELMCGIFFITTMIFFVAYKNKTQGKSDQSFSTIVAEACVSESDPEPAPDDFEKEATEDVEIASQEKESIIVDLETPGTTTPETALVVETPETEAPTTAVETPETDPAPVAVETETEAPAPMAVEDVVLDDISTSDTKTSKEVDPEPTLATATATTDAEKHNSLTVGETLPEGTEITDSAITFPDGSFIEHSITSQETVSRNGVSYTITHYDDGTSTIN